MKTRKSLRGLMSVAVIALSVTAFVGCGGVTEEQLKQLDDARKEVISLEKQASSLKDERARLEREIAEKNKKLEDCAKLKAETQANLAKLPK